MGRTAAKSAYDPVTVSAT
jgi:hypothetical protein